MAVKIDYEMCTACQLCYDRCPEDVFAWDDDDERPVVKYPYECWYCGACYIDCEGEAITLETPVFMRFVPQPYVYEHKREIEREYETGPTSTPSIS